MLKASQCLRGGIVEWNSALMFSSSGDTHTHTHDLINITRADGRSGNDFVIINTYFHFFSAHQSERERNTRAGHCDATPPRAHRLLARCVHHHRQLVRFFLYHLLQIIVWKLRQSKSSTRQLRSSTVLADRVRQVGAGNAVTMGAAAHCVPENGRSF